MRQIKKTAKRLKILKKEKFAGQPVKFKKII